MIHWHKFLVCKLSLAADSLTSSHFYCRDKPKFGGPGKKKQACMYVCDPVYTDMIIKLFACIMKC